MGGLLETDDGMLWIGTRRGGLNRFDRATETFKAYRHVPGDSTSLSNDLVWAFHESDDGRLWIGTDGGVNRFDVASETFETYRHVPDDPTSLSHDRAWALYESDHGTLWVGTWAAASADSMRRWRRSRSIGMCQVTRPA
jgi:ligand-binding sensor domain-containing protein